VGVPKFPQLGLPRFWGPINLCANLELRWGMKQNCSLHRKLFNNMLHATYTQRKLGWFLHLAIGSQIANLTSIPSNAYNLCVKCPNRSCEPILDIYVPRYFQWYKEPLNLMGFDLYNRSLKIWESIEIPTPKVGVHLGVYLGVRVHSPTLSCIPGLTSWPASL